MDTRCGPALNMRGGYTVFCLKSAYGVRARCGLSFHQFKKDHVTVFQSYAGGADHRTIVKPAFALSLSLLSV